MVASDWVLLGAPWDCSGMGRGEQAAPAALRAAGLRRVVSHDAGDADTKVAGTTRDPATGVLALADSLRAAASLAGALTRLVADFPAHRPIVVGGDCSILLGIVPALRATVGPIGLWFIDGHPDYLDGHTSQSGETADMGLAVLTGDGAEPLVTLAGRAPMVPVTDAVLLGHRTEGLDEGAVVELARVPDALRRIDAAALAEDPAAAGERAAGWLARTGRGVWLHLDLDVLDPASLPAVTYPQAAGPDWQQLSETLRPLARSRRLLGISVADFRPDLDPTGALATRIVDLVDHVLLGQD